MTSNPRTDADQHTNDDEGDGDEITTAIARHQDRLVGIVCDIIADATDAIRTDRARLEAELARATRENQRLQERNDYLRDRLHHATATATAHPTATDTTTGEAVGHGDAAGVVDLLDTTTHDCTLANIAKNGPDEAVSRVYPVHERAHAVLTNLGEWGELTTDDEGTWAVDVTAPRVRDGVATVRDEDLSSTQTRRVLETIADWGGECPSPPRLNKTSDGVLRLRLRDGLAVSTVLSSPTDGDREREREDHGTEPVGSGELEH